ncbi:MAG: ABC transporter ATP-binding protein [Pseudomonadota bacterium]
MSQHASNSQIVLTDVSKFYGDVLGVNRVNLILEPGITGLVGPNGAGKSTLMNLIAGLMYPNRGTIELFGMAMDDPERFYRTVGYCTQYDTFPVGVTGYQFIYNSLRLRGYSHAESEAQSWRAIERVDLVDAARRSVESYSKGMRQRMRLAQSMCHDPRVLILDEPLNGLDPMARAQVIAVFREFADTGAHVLVSSHILHEVDLISDQVILLDNGYVVAEGEVAGIRGETGEPMRIFIRTDHAAEVAAFVFSLPDVIEAHIHNDGRGLFVSTSDAGAFFLAINGAVVTQSWNIEVISPTDETVEALYEHLITREVVAT